MALEGSLTDFGLADILQLIYFQRKTGILTLEGKLDRVKLFFIDGNISGAESKRRTDDNRLGKILLKKGVIKEADLQASLEEQRKTGVRLGNVFIKRGLVQKEVIMEIINSQINETVTQLFTWKQGTYEFAAQGVPQDKDLPFSLDTQHLLMEGLRILDEWSLIKGKITIDSIFHRKMESPTDLTEEEKEIFSCVDGENDVSTISDLTTRDNFEVSKILLALMDKGIIDGTDAAPVIAEIPVAEIKAPLPFVQYLPLIAVVFSLLLSIWAAVSLQTDIMKKFRAAESIDSLRFGIETYRLEHGAYPQNLDVISPHIDPWGKAYVFAVTENSFTLSSAGPDGKEGSADDIF